jgi:hypothetical protein
MLSWTLIYPRKNGVGFLESGGLVVVVQLMMVGVDGFDMARTGSSCVALEADGSFAAGRVRRTS